MSDPKDHPLSDAELVALAAVVQSEALGRASYDAERIRDGVTLYYGTSPTEASIRLELELRRRRVLP